MKANRRENQVSAGIQGYLETRTDVYFWRANVSAGMAPSGQFMRSGVKGQSDFFCIQAPEGKWVAIEVKREKGGKISDEQIRFGANIVLHGGKYIVARDVETVAKALGPVRAHVVKIRPPRVVHR